IVIYAYYKYATIIVYTNTTASGTTMKKGFDCEMKSTFEQPHFLLCGSCYWCASYLSLRVTVEICPSCLKGKVVSMPTNISL
ncbi:MAG: hypothetical protein M3P08_15780, partial [Thermoproteota archaeon]|nr:hypothetical protein [Thermoproteota archaeon]